jgi:hypothetical protein
VDPWCTATGILSVHLEDEISDRTGNDRSSRLGVPHLPRPEKTKALAMPGHGRDDGQQRAPSRSRCGRARLCIPQIPSAANGLEISDMQEGSLSLG